MQIKGLKDGLLVTLGEGAWQDRLEELLLHVQQQENFFKGARLALDVGNRILYRPELEQLRAKLAEKGVVLWAILSNSPATEQSAQEISLATRITPPRSDRVIRPVDPNLPGEAAILVQKTLRSGFKVSYHGHVIVLGDVNPGAEITASGSIIVWGKLRGVVHAGAEGDENAMVCALDLAPMQLRIAGYIAVTPQRKGKPEPEIARIEHNQVVAESWIPKAK
ncbi:MAG TPA: septum site-determining protein MinC [Anaerolineaceae bacterium]